MKTTDNIQSLSRNEIAYQDFGQNYLSYINQCKTEWEATEYAENALLQAGFQPLSQWLDNGQRLQPGDKVYAKNRDRGLCAAVIGTEPQAGFQVIGAHLDSPVVFLRPNPVFSRCGFALGSTFSRGGIKPYQWLSIPLAIHGKILKKMVRFRHLP